MRPFRSWHGSNIPEHIKALILQLDPGDDEAEHAIRIATERRATRNIRQAFQEMLDTLYPEGYGEFQDPNLEAMRVQRLFLEQQSMYDALSRALQDGADLGVSAAVQQFENIGFGFDWTLVNTNARRWAEQHAGELIRQVEQTTVDSVRQAVGRWIGNGEPLQALIDDLAPTFGIRRAERIAATEITTAFAEGNIQSYQASGLITRPPHKRPVRDSHIGCRCWLVLSQNNAGEWVYFWRTAMDELVCPICAPLANTEQ